MVFALFCAAEFDASFRIRRLFFPLIFYLDSIRKSYGGLCALLYDHLTLVMTVTVTVVAFLIHLYSRGYMEHEARMRATISFFSLPQSGFLFMRGAHHSVTAALTIH